MTERHFEYVTRGWKLPPGARLISLRGVGESVSVAVYETDTDTEKANTDTDSELEQARAAVVAAACELMAHPQPGGGTVLKAALHRFERLLVRWAFVASRSQIDRRLQELEAADA